MSIHIPRRTGVGARQVLAPKKAKPRPYRFRPAAPDVCGAIHPDLGHRAGLRGDLFDPVTCTARQETVWDPETRKTVVHTHRGKHRAKVAGVLLRWTDEAVA